MICAFCLFPYYFNVSFISSTVAALRGVREKAHLAGRPDITPGPRVQPHELHSLVFAVKQVNMETLAKLLHNVSDPSSLDYGKHWTRAKVTELTANPTASQKISNYLESHGLQILSKTSAEDYITAEGKVSVWESMFATRFYEFKHKHWNNAKIIRAMEYSLPNELSGHVEFVFDLIDFPVPVYGKPVINSRSNDISTESAIMPVFNDVNPALLKKIYGISNNTGNALTSQAVFSTLGQTFSPSDLSIFQTTYNIPKQSIAHAIGAHVKDDACISEGLEYCGEVNLEMQYLMSTAQNIPTTFFYSEGSLLKWIKTVSNMVDPPKVFTISFVSPELYLSTYYINAFNAEAMKLGIMGVTLLAAAGDDGAAGYDVREGDLQCGYFPNFPATSPYVTVVGATQVKIFIY